MINFKANYINSTTVQKKDFNNQYKDYKVAFVEFSPHEAKDVLALRDTAREWKDGDQFAKEIYRDIQEEYYAKDYYQDSKYRFFGITRQLDGLENPISDLILGIAEVGKKSDIRDELYYFQVDPSNNMFSEEKMFKGIGSAVLNSIKNLYAQSEIILKPVSDDAVVSFYKKHNFKPLEFTGKLIWRA